ncbi:hypothetical protein AAMO2058_000422800 [Amorphochlora amoebiformis]
MGGEAGGCYPLEHGWSQRDAHLVVKSALSPNRTKSCAQHMSVEANRTKGQTLSNPLVAVCMVGNARTLPTLGVYRRIRSNFLDSISKRTLLFMYIKLNDAPFKEQPKHGGFKVTPVKEDDLIPVIRHLRPVSVTMKLQTEGGRNLGEDSNPKCKFTVQAANRTKQNAFYVGRYLARYIGQMHAMKECYKSVMDFEKMSGIKFDAIAKIRPDVTWIYPVKTAVEMLFGQDRENKVVTHLTDQFIFSPRRFSDGFVSFWKEYKDCNGEWEGAYFPEDAYRLGFEKQGIRSYYEDRRGSPQVIRRAIIDQTAHIACRRQRRITNETMCIDMVYNRDDPALYD